MLKSSEQTALGRGVYSAAEALRLLNFSRDSHAARRVSRQTVARWLRGYDYPHGEGSRFSPPLWQPDYPIVEDEPLELSFRDLIELRFVKAFRDLGLGLPTIRRCFQRAVDEVRDERPFSTRRFRTDGKTIFLEITHDVREGELIDLKQRQGVFRAFVAPSLRDLEFDAGVVSRWFPLGLSRNSIVVDPNRCFGRPVVIDAGIPVEALVDAVAAEGSAERAAALYELPLRAVRDAVAFQQKLAA